jgi:copper chaperone CopZ
MRFLFVLIVFLYSCNQNATSNAVQKKSKVHTEQKKEVHPTHIAVATVEGMVCKMGCGGAIRKGLTEMGGISSVEIEYEDDRSAQLVKVNYDNSEINKELISDMIEEINDEQFSVLDFKSESIK